MVNKENIKYYINILLVLSIMLISYMYFISDNNVYSLVTKYNDNKLEVEDTGTLYLNYIDTNYTKNNIKIYNNNDIDLAYKLLYRIYDTNINLDNFIIRINNNNYLYKDIKYKATTDYTDILIYNNIVNSSTIDNIELSFILDDTENDDYYIEGDYVVEANNSYVVYK